MKIFYKIVLITFISSHLQALDFGDMFLELKAIQDNLVVKTKNEEITYFTKNKKQIRIKKIYKKDKLMKIINYSYDSGYKKKQIEFTYDETAKDKKIKFKTILKKSYSDNGNIFQEYKKGSKYKIYTKRFYKDGTLSSLITYHKKNSKEKSLVVYNKDGSLKAKETFDDDKRTLKEYKNGVLIKDGTYLANVFEYIPNGVISTYNSNGVIVSETFYTNGDYEYNSNCNFSTISYMKELKRKYNNDLYGKKHGDIKCLKLDKANFVMATNYTENKKKTKTIVAIIDINKNIIKQSLLHKKSNIEDEYGFYFANKTYSSIKNTDVFDIVSESRLNMDEIEILYNTYKITKDKVMVLKKPTFNLNNIEKQSKTGSDFSTNELFAMMFEVPITVKTVAIYNNIAYYLQKNELHAEATTLLEEILYRFPNRFVAYLNIGDSYLALKREKDALYNYKKYVGFMNKKGKKKKIPNKVAAFISDNEIVCLSSSNISSEILNIDDNMDEIVFKDSKGKTIKQVIFLNFTDVKKRFFYKDLDFDGVKELLVNISSHEQSEEYKVFSVKCDKIAPFSLKTLYHFELNNEDKTLLEYKKDENNKQTISIYCSDAKDGKYYLCDEK